MACPYMGHLEIQKHEHKPVLPAPGMLAESREHEEEQRRCLSTVTLYSSEHPGVFTASA